MSMLPADFTLPTTDGGILADGAAVTPPLGEVTSTVYDGGTLG